MSKLSKNIALTLGAGMVLLLALMASPAMAQDLEKKYEPIVGDYEFDMSEGGMGVMTVAIYVENGALWAWPKDMGDPGEMIPKEDAEFVFKIYEDDGSVWVLEFLKDESGNYTTCHAVNEVMGADITGEKIVKLP